MYYALSEYSAFAITKLDNVNVEFNKESSCCLLIDTNHKIYKQVSADSNIDINQHTFEQDALIYQDVDKIKLYDQNRLVVSINANKYEYVWLWSNSLNFICIVPWYGISDIAN